MTPRIESVQEKKLIGHKLIMSFSNFKIGELWKNFSPRKSEIKNQVSTDLISMVIYSPTHFTNFKPTNEFEKWAAIEVSDFGEIPEGMETFILPAGLYAIFDYKGLSADNSIFQYIYGNWIPNSEYELDDRPHFEILGEKYKNNDPTSEEEIWIPIKSRKF